MPPSSLQHLNASVPFTLPEERGLSPLCLRTSCDRCQWQCGESLLLWKMFRSLLTASLQIRIIIGSQWGPWEQQSAKRQGFKCSLSLEMRLKSPAWTSAPKIPRVCAHASPMCTDMNPSPDSSSFLLSFIEVFCDLVSPCFGSMVEKPSYHRILGDGKADWPRDCIPRNRMVRRRCRMVLPTGDMLEQNYGGESWKQSTSPLDIPRLSGNSK